MKFSEVDDLNYQCSIEETYPGELGLMIKKTSFLVVFLPIIKLFVKSLVQLFSTDNKRNFPIGIDTVVIVGSINQYRAVKSLIDALPNVLVLSIFPIKCKNNVVIDTRGNCIASLLNLPKLIINLVRVIGFKYSSILYHFDDYLNTPGVYNLAHKYLKEINPKSIIVANDHTFLTRSYFRAAQKLKISTIYTQHASVTSHFPSLEFDYAFLDGEETLDKYLSNNEILKSKVFLSGSPRFDKIAEIKNLNNYELGVAINLIDNHEEVIKFLELLVLNKVNFCFRPHPGLPNISFWKEYCKTNSIGYSDPITETPIDFISYCKSFAVGDSALHLEVALCGKTSYYFNFQNGNTSDSYDYIRNGLIEEKDSNEIILFLKQQIYNKVSTKKIKYYVANFSTKEWGNSTTLIQKSIMDINNDNKLDFWQEKKVGSYIFEINN
ncbi:hypothetical protein [Flavobacterium aestivum]|uniref:hypothetical protein n=1 Tax=Flavobacterium aestivum TaxID=3003257 RepID=UPI0024832226|nr:hypothetical protein [Flavobacterium aestivum]